MTEAATRRARLALASLAVLLAGAAPAAETVPQWSDCRYGRKGDPPEPRTTALPRGDVFRPLLADPKEPRFSATYARFRFRSRGLPAEAQGETIDGAVAGLGSSFGLYGWRSRDEGCDGGQVGVFGAVFSQFNLDTSSSDLLNSDFVGGFPLTLRRGPLSLRARAYHQSSHLGDEFLLNNPEVQRLNFSYEALDALGSVDVWRRQLRVYGGGGGLVRTEPRIDPWLAQWGVEARPSGLSWRPSSTVALRPTAGVDWKAYEQHRWSVDTSVAAGGELAGPLGTRRLRLLFVYLDGFLPYGQFFDTEKVKIVGVELQFEL
jgi:hypothetical protein